MPSSTINELVIDYTQKIADGQRENGVLGMLQSLCKTLHDAQVWPPTPDRVCDEVTATYNYTLVNMSGLVCDYKLVSSTFGESKTNDVISATLKRVHECIIGSSFNEGGQDENVIQQMLTILKALENSVFHFKALTILGRLLLLVTAVCLHKRHAHGSSLEIVTCLLRFTEMAGVPVLKLRFEATAVCGVSSQADHREENCNSPDGLSPERCHFHHGLLLASPLSKDAKEEDVRTVVVEDVVCLFLATFHQPVKNLVMEHWEWKWLFTAIECRNLMKEKSYAMAMQKLHAFLTLCMDSLHKCRLLCLFADCYFHMGCPQLSIQTYRDALQTNSTHYPVLYQLSLVYQSLDLPELELESLNLCVMALADVEKRKKDKFPVMDIDELVWSIAPPVTPVSYIRVKVTFARRCLQLKRYPEAAEQYSSLIRLLQQEETFLQFEKHETDRILNIAEILVEAAEVLLITRQYQDCIRLCNNTQPSLSADDTIAKNSQMIVDSPESSQSDIFDLLRNSQSDISINPSLSPRRKFELQTGGNDSATDLCVSFEKSRKRMRSCDPMAAESTVGTLSESSDDAILMTRLLLCKADALVLSEGFTDNAVCCLQLSMDTLIRQPPTSANKPDLSLKDDASVSHPPHSKRLRISSDGEAAACVQHEESDTSGGSDNNRVWSKLLVDTALRMAAASWKRERFPSVINSCRVVEQLDKGNTDAAYIKTHVMSERKGCQREAICHWLNKRGVTYLVDRKELEGNIKRIQQMSRTCEESDSNSNWWRFNENDRVDLDVKCLSLLLDNHAVVN